MNVLSASAEVDEQSSTKLSLQIGKTNAIGVYGSRVTEVKEQLSRGMDSLVTAITEYGHHHLYIATGEAPSTMFDNIAQEVLNDLRMDVFPRFHKSDFFERYIRAKSLERDAVTHKDFTMLRMLGRGAFGAVRLVLAITILHDHIIYITLDMANAIITFAKPYPNHYCDCSCP